jgi:hypothetical protein
MLLHDPSDGCMESFHSSQAVFLRPEKIAPQAETSQEEQALSNGIYGFSIS